MLLQRLSLLRNQEIIVPVVFIQSHNQSRMVSLLLHVTELDLSMSSEGPSSGCSTYIRDELRLASLVRRSNRRFGGRILSSHAHSYNQPASRHGKNSPNLNLDRASNQILRQCEDCLVAPRDVLASARVNKCKEGKEGAASNDHDPMWRLARMFEFK